MERSIDRLAAVRAGKLPSTRQLTAWIDLALSEQDTLLNPEGWSPRGRAVVEDVRAVGDAWKTLLAEKNGDDVAQEALYRTALAAADERLRTRVKDAASQSTDSGSDAGELVASLRTLAVAFFSQVKPGAAEVESSVLGVLVVLAEETESAAGRAREVLADKQEKAEAGEDTLTRRGLRGEPDAQKRFEKGMDLARDVGSAGIGVGQDAAGKGQDLRDRTRTSAEQKARDRLNEARRDAKFREAFDNILKLARKYIHDVHVDAEPPKLASWVDQDSSGHLRTAFESVDALVPRYTGDRTLQGLSDRLWPVVVDLHEHKSPELDRWCDDGEAWLRRIVDEDGFAESDECTQRGRELRDRWQELLSGEGPWQEHARALTDYVRGAWYALRDDPAVRRLARAHLDLGKDVAAMVGIDVVQGGLVDASSLLHDVVDVILPRLASMAKQVPLPRTEITSPEGEFVIEDLNLTDLSLLPGTVRVSQKVDLEASKESVASDATTSSGASSGEIVLRGGRFQITNMSFYARQAKGLVKKNAGYADLQLGEKGFDAQISYKLRTGAAAPGERAGLCKVERVHVDLNDFDIKVRKDDHNILTSLFRGPIRTKIETNIKTILESLLRTAFEALDGIVADTRMRIDVFKDAGAPIGAAVIGGIQSEVRNLLQQTSILDGLHVTPVGFVIDHPSSDTTVAVGAGPQIISGDKHGPEATGSETPKAIRDIQQGAEQGRGEAGKQAAGAAGAAGQSGADMAADRARLLQERVDREKQSEGWRTSAYDVGARAPSHL